MIPFSNTTCSAIAEANAAADETATLLYGIAVAAVLHELDLTYIEADEPPLMPMLDADRAEDLWTRMRDFAAANPTASLRTATTFAYTDLRGAMMLRPKMH